MFLRGGKNVSHHNIDCCVQGENLVRVKVRCFDYG